METIYKVWVEWDLGQSEVAFKSEEGAKAWVMQRLEENDPDLIDEYPTFEELENAGLSGVGELQVI